jgi:hypothetical protein
LISCVDKLTNTSTYFACIGDLTITICLLINELVLFIRKYGTTHNQYAEINNNVEINNDAIIQTTIELVYFYYF